MFGKEILARSMVHKNINDPSRNHCERRQIARAGAQQAERTRQSLGIAGIAGAQAADQTGRHAGLNVAGARRASPMDVASSAAGHAEVQTPSHGPPSLTKGYFTARSGSSRPRMSTRKFSRAPAGTRANAMALPSVGEKMPDRISPSPALVMTRWP